MYRVTFFTKLVLNRVCSMCMNRITNGYVCIGVPTDNNIPGMRVFFLSTYVTVLVIFT